MAYSLRALKKFSVLDVKRDGSANNSYCLAVPVDEAVKELRARGFSPVALVG